MAWINNKWLNRKERQELIDQTTDLINLMMEQESLGKLSPSDYEEVDALLDSLSRLQRIHRSETDLLYFSLEYFSDRHNPDNMGSNWAGFDLETTDDAAEFHKEITASMDYISMKKVNAKVVKAAPRSHGKSTYLSRGNPTREIVFRKRHFILLISETPSVSEPNVEWIANQLKFNKKLREDFGPLLSPKKQMNIKDNSSEFIAWEPDGEDGKKQLTIVQAASTGQALKGRAWNGHRPDLITGDDLESLETNAATKEQREKLNSWYNTVVEPLGDPEGILSAFIIMGTVCHQDCLLNTLINNRPDFESKKYKALIEPPTNMELWDQCRSIYQSDTIPVNEREELALKFYEENKEAMDEGAVLLWGKVQPIWKLMKFKWSRGSKAFNSEYQNDPRDEESQIFIPEKFTYFKESDLVTENGNPMPLDYYGFWDVALGKSSRADYNAIVTVARNRNTGIIYIVDAWAKKVPMHKAMEVAIEKIQQYGHKVFGVETIGVSGDMYRQLREALAKESIYFTKLKPVSHHSAKKEKRIETLEPLIEGGSLRFMKHQTLLLDQLEQFPSGQHDDLPDAVSSVIDICGAGRMRRTWNKKPAGL